MIKINLLPVRQIKRRTRLRRQIGALIVCFVLLLAAMAAAASYQTKRIEELEKSITGLQTEKQSFDPLLREIKELKEQKKVIEGKINVIKTLKTNSLLAVRVLDQLASLTPQNRMWLTAVNQSGGMLSLQGIALDNATVAQYMKDMTVSPWFGEAELLNTSLTDMSGQKLKSFSINVSISSPAADSNEPPSGDQKNQAKKGA